MCIDQGRNSGIYYTENGVDYLLVDNIRRTIKEEERSRVRKPVPSHLLQDLGLDKTSKTSRFSG